MDATYLTPKRRPQTRRPRRRAAGLFAGPAAEALEARTVLASLTFHGPVVHLPPAPPAETLDQARHLGDLSALAGGAAAAGSIGTGAAGAADVDWYEFTLDRPERVSLSLTPSPGGGSFRGVLSLYNTDPFDFNDPLDPTGHRLLAQGGAPAGGGPAGLDVVLGPGTYDVAVSGAGNELFSPFVAGSGYAGSTGAFRLVAAAADVGLAADAGPTVLASDPAPGASPSASPLAVRLDLSGPIDPGTATAGETVSLLFNPSGAFGDGHDSAVALASLNFAAPVNELQLVPAGALAPGYYRVVLAGDASAGAEVLASPSGTPLGADAAHPRGRDETVTFHVTAGATPHDTPATALELGNVTDAGRVHAAGAIGTDPYYSTAAVDGAPVSQSNPGNQVNLYHFRVTGAGPHALIAEVFAGRIGSPLDASVAVYQLDPSDGALRFVAGNYNTNDPTTGTDQSTPLFSDPAVFAVLSAGDYYLAVASGANTPSPLDGVPPGSPGLYDPSVSHSGADGAGTGPYVLNLMVRTEGDPPGVTATTPANGQTVAGPPTTLSVRFTEPLNFQQLAYAAYASSSVLDFPSVYVQGADGTRYFPRYRSFDDATGWATFEMMDALPNGTYEFHLSGPGGLADLGGAPLKGNTPGGDYVTRFTVDGPPRGSTAGPRTWVARPDPGGPAAPQDLGVLFPHELEAGVAVVRAGGSSPSAAGDAYRFRVTEWQIYGLTLSGDALPAGATVRLTDASGTAVDLGQAQGGGLTYVVRLAPGTYDLHVVAGAPGAPGGPAVRYRVDLSALSASANPAPLVAGPAPALSLHLDGFATATAPSAAPVSSSALTVSGFAEGGASSTAGPAGPPAVAGSAAPSPEVSGLAGVTARGPASPTVSAGGAAVELAGLAAGPVGGEGGGLGVGPAGTAAASPQVVLAATPAAVNQMAAPLLTLIESYHVAPEDAPAALEAALPASAPAAEVVADGEAPAPVVVVVPAPGPEAAPVGLTPVLAFEAAPVAPPLGGTEGGDPAAGEAPADLLAAEPAAEQDDERVTVRADLTVAAAVTVLFSVAVMGLKKRAGGPSARILGASGSASVPGRPLGLDLGGVAVRFRRPRSASARSARG